MKMYKSSCCIDLLMYTLGMSLAMKYYKFSEANYIIQQIKVLFSIYRAHIISGYTCLVYCTYIASQFLIMLAAYKCSRNVSTHFILKQLTSNLPHKVGWMDINLGQWFLSLTIESVSCWFVSTATGVSGFCTIWFLAHQHMYVSMCFDT